MRLKLIILLLFPFLSFAAQVNYYVSAAGDNTTGLSPAHAWRTISKINSSLGIVNAGDSILFHRGEIFTGTITISKNGISGFPIIFDAYGIGDKPIISGFTTLTSWTSLGSNLYECTPAIRLKKNCNVLTIDDVPQAVGRTNWMTYQASTAGTITSSSLTGTPSYVGAELVMRNKSFVSQKGRITAQSGGTLTYVTTQGIDNGKSGSPDPGTNGWGFFLQRFAGSLDQQGEWFYDSATNKVKIYSTVNPATFTIQASCVDTLAWVSNHSYITFSNLSFEGAGMYGTACWGAKNITIKNCSFNNNTRAMYFWNGDKLDMTGNTVNNSFNSAIRVGLNSGTPTTRVNIIDNVITNTGQLFGMGVYWSAHDLKGVVAEVGPGTGTNYLNIIGNVVRNTGYMAIEFKGSNVLVRRNWTDSFCNNMDDGGGIYSFVNNQTVNTSYPVNRLIDSNFISNGIGAPLGAPAGHLDITGYYMDDQVCYTTGQYNTVWNIPGDGVQFNNPYHNIYKYNTSYNCTYPMIIAMKKFGPLVGDSIIGNILYQKTSSQFNFYHVNANIDYPTTITIAQSIQRMAFIDSNWITNMQSGGYDYCYASNTIGTTCPTNITLAQWRATYGHDLVSTLPPITVTNTNTRLEVNPSVNPLTIGLGAKYRDAKNVLYNGAITLAPFTSAVLIYDSPLSANISPNANAGTNQTTTLPINSVTLSGSGSDPDGTIASHSWAKISGPSTYTIVNSALYNTAVNNLVQGVYQFALTVTDNLGLSAKDTVMITVNAAPNLLPNANAGADSAITLPVNSVHLIGMGTDADGTISTYAWVKVSGSGGTIVSPTSANTVVNSLSAGVYKYELTVTDNSGGTAKDTVQITVNAAINLIPVAHAGTDSTITLPVNSVHLIGSGTDADGTISSYAWVKISGPTCTITSASSASTTVTGMVQGVYDFELTVTDNNGATAKDTVQVTVNAAANLTPICSAGTDIIIQLPVTYTTLSGSASDPDGTISYKAWAQHSGASCTISGSSSLTPTITGMITAGVYEFDLTVTDNLGATSTDRVQVTVKVENIYPVANAGTDIAVISPATSTILMGTATDADGTISSYQWLKLSGSGGTIETPLAATTAITGLSLGVYQYELRVIDNDYATTKDTITVTVYPHPNQAPSVSGGGNRSITLPVNAVTLIATSTDDGTIVSYGWAKISGPSTYTITDATNDTTDVTDMVEGVYQFQVTVTDDSGAVARDTINITVNPIAPVANIEPAADAGFDTTIAYNGSAFLTGIGTDIDGTISSYQWSEGATILGTTDTLAYSGSPGLHTLTLTVTDDDGATDTDTVIITVSAAPRQRIILYRYKVP